MDSADAEKPEGAPVNKPMTAAAERALAEARLRKAGIDAREAALKQVRELAGRGGLDPVRYDDWEVKGIASDF